jgi:hypothetical protein
MLVAAVVQLEISEKKMRDPSFLQNNFQNLNFAYNNGSNWYSQSWNNHFC